MGLALITEIIIIMVHYWDFLNQDPDDYTLQCFFLDRTWRARAKADHKNLLLWCHLVEAAYLYGKKKLWMDMAV